jgi:hypothetical protein
MRCNDLICLEDNYVKDMFLKISRKVAQTALSVRFAAFSRPVAVFACIAIAAVVIAGVVWGVSVIRDRPDEGSGISAGIPDSAEPLPTDDEAALSSISPPEDGGMPSPETGNGQRNATLISDRWSKKTN